MLQIRQALRSLLGQPGFSFVAVLTLALGIGATAAIFTVFDAVLLQPLPYPDADRVVLVLERAPKFPNPISLSVLNFPDVRDQATGFGRVGVVRSFTMNLTGGDDPVRVNAKMLSSDVLPTLKVQPLIGRAFSADDDKAGAEAVAVISYALWQSRFGGSPSILQQAVQLDEAPVKVIGVMPKDFRILSAADVYVPVWPWLSHQLQDRTWHPGLTGIARLKDGVALDQAQTNLDQISAQLEQAYPEANLGTKFIAVPVLTQMVQGVRTALLVLVAAVAGVLLIACANVAGLLLARGLSRRREIAVRTSLGATRGHIIALVLSESTLLAVIGAAAGLLLAAMLVPALVSLAGTTLPRAELVTINLRVVGFAAVLAMATALIFGVLPAVTAARVDLRDVLSEGGRGNAGGAHQRRTRRALVIAEIALTTALLVAAGLLLRSFAKLGAVDPGFSPDRLMVAELPLSPKTYADNAVRTLAVERLLERVEALPGVESAAVTTLLPLSGTGGSIHFNIQRRPPKSAKDWILTSVRAVTHAYFDTMGMQIVSGRGFTALDREGTPTVTIVSEAFVKTYMPNDEPIGQKISLGTEFDGTLPWLEIIGVSADVRQTADADGRSEIFVPYEQYPDPFFSRMYQNITVAVRTAGAPGALAPAFRAAVAEIDRNQPIVNLRTMTTLMDGAVAQPKFRTALIALFAAIALVLAGIGVYGLLAHGVVQRRGEFGVRLALGASPGQVTSLVVREGLVLAAVGLALGLATAAFAVRLIQTMLFNVTAWDAAAWVSAVGALAVVTLIASWIPARRSARVPPADALRG
jgi:putative ABC transport system permease protein